MMLRTLKDDAVAPSNIAARERRVIVRDKVPLVIPWRAVRSFLLIDFRAFGMISNVSLSSPVSAAVKAWTNQGMTSSPRLPAAAATVLTMMTCQA